MKVLVTGATGFVGTALSRRLVEQAHQVEKLGSANCDLRKADSLEAFNGVSYDRIFHLAAWTQAGDFCLHHPGEQWIINQQMNTNVLTWWQKRQPQAKMIALGTSCSYEPGSALQEDEYLLGTPIESLYTYAQTKRMMYVGLLSLQKQFGLKYLHLVPSTLYGPGYHTDGRQMHFIFDLIRKIMAGKLYGQTVALWGDGYQKRELVFLDDFINAVLGLDAITENQTVNIGSGQEHTIREFAARICGRLEYDQAKIQYDTSKYVGARSKCLDVSRLRKLLPGLKMTPLQAGLEKTIDWFWENREVLLKSRP
jgi:GDP-L-fucose synthase